MRSKRPPRALAPTISDVAAEAGVSRATAARTLGDYGYVSDEARQRVLGAAQRLEYRVNALARSMSTGRTHTLGIVVGDIGNPFFAGVVKGIGDTARENGFDAIVLSTDEELEAEKAAMGVLVDKRVDGIVLASAATNHAEAGHIHDTLRMNIPIVLIDRAPDFLQLPAVVINNRESARHATEYLIRRGHHAIGFVWGPRAQTTPRTRRELMDAASKNLWTEAQRLCGYLDALDDGRIQLNIALVMDGEKCEAGVEAFVGSLLDSDEPPSAILCTETIAMTGCLKAMRSRGLRHPEDVSLIGFDDSSWAAVFEPPITMIEQPMHELGATAARTLLAEISGAHEPSAIVTLPGRFVERSSVQPILSTIGAPSVSSVRDA